jgi:hypothetical protein
VPDQPKPYVLWLTDPEREALKRHMMVAAEVSPDQPLRSAALRVIRLALPATVEQWVAEALPILSGLAEDATLLEERFSRAVAHAWASPEREVPKLTDDSERTVHLPMRHLRKARDLVKRAVG